MSDAVGRLKRFAEANACEGVDVPYDGAHDQQWRDASEVLAQLDTLRASQAEGAAALAAYRKWLTERVAETPLPKGGKGNEHTAYLYAWGELERRFPFLKPATTSDLMEQP